MNKIYNGDLVDIYKRQLKRKLNNQGFSNSKVQVYPIFNDANNSVVLNFNIQQGQRSYVRQVIFQETPKQKIELLESFLRWKAPGTMKIKFNSAKEN